MYKLKFVGIVDVLIRYIEERINGRNEFQVSQKWEVTGALYITIFSILFLILGMQLLINSMPKQKANMDITDRH